VGDEIDEKLSGQDSRLDRLRNKEQKNHKKTTKGYTPTNLIVGQRVVLQDQKSRLWEIKGIIQSIRPGARSAYVKTAAGLFLRNRRYIKTDPAFQEEYIEAVLGIRLQVSREPVTRHRAERERVGLSRAPGVSEGAGVKLKVSFQLFVCEAPTRATSCTGVKVLPGEEAELTPAACQCRH
jgi:hypothetical protein